MALEATIAEAQKAGLRDIVREFGNSLGFCYGDITDLWTSNELADIMVPGKLHKIAWELNIKTILSFPDFYKRFFYIGKELGVCFNAGLNAHRLCDIDMWAHKNEVKKYYSYKILGDEKHCIYTSQPTILMSFFRQTTIFTQFFHAVQSPKCC